MRVSNISKSVIDSSGNLLRSLLFERPQKISRPLGLEYLPLQKDVCEFKTDYSLCPTFLHKLVSDLDALGTDNVKKIYYMRDKFLKAMGYKSSPDLLKIEPYPSGCDFWFKDATLGFASQSNSIYYTESINNFDNIVLLNAIRHELDHFDIYAKLIACEGYDKVFEALANQSKRTAIFLYSDIGKKIEPQNVIINFHNYDINSNKKFWEIFSKEANVKNFDSKKYMNYLNECFAHELLPTVTDLQKTIKLYLYWIDPLEKSAYNCNLKIFDAFGIKLGKNYESFIDLEKGMDAILKEYNTDITGLIKSIKWS